MNTNMRVYTDTIQAESAKIMSKVEFEQKSRQLTELIKEINGIVRGFGGLVNHDGIKIQVQVNSLLDISQRPTITNRKRTDYPFELSVNVGGVKYFAVTDREEWLEFAKDNSICPECGKDFEWCHNYETGEKTYRCPNGCEVYKGE